MDTFLETHKPLYEVKANLFKGLAHPVRVRVLEILTQGMRDGDNRGIGVFELLDDTGLEPSHLSGHLAILRRNNLVTADRRGSQVYYRLAYPQVADLLAVARGLLVEILQRTQQQLDSASSLPPIPDASQDYAAIDSL
jgi:DNA-binding transcriptional ArsR family regulator